MNATIEIAAIKRTPGKDKRGKPYERTSLKSEGGDWFSTLNSHEGLDLLLIGQTVDIEYELNGQYKNLTKVGKVHPAAKQKDSRSTTEPPLPTALTNAQSKTMMAGAIIEVMDEFPDISHAQLIPLIAEHYKAKLQAQQQEFSAASQVRIQYAKWGK